MIIFLGAVDEETRSLAEKEGLKDIVDFKGYMKHKESISFLLGAHVLLLTIDEGGESIITGKVFEYLASGKPILALVPPSGMAADILRKERRGEYIVNPRDVELIKERLTSLYARYKKGCLPTYPVNNLNAYTRKEASEKLSRLLNDIKQ
jgi:glycosyltransferase involved in cell wall biosynthesis